MFIRQKIAKSFHPGEMLREKLEELDMPVKEFSLRCNKPEATIHAVLNGSSSVTSDMALLFEKVLGIPALMWLNLQSRYDEYNSRQQLEEELEASRDWVARFPFSEMVSKGYIEAPKPCSLIEKTLVLLTFMGFAKPSAWEKYYQHQALPADFRLSLAGIPEAHALSAWLRYGEIKAREQSDIHPFDASILRSQIEKMKYLANQGKQDFLPNLISLCNEAGVILVCTPHLRKSMARGATRWIKLNPLVQVSDSYKRYDIFWFSFFMSWDISCFMENVILFWKALNTPNRIKKKKRRPMISPAIA